MPSKVGRFTEVTLKNSKCIEATNRLIYHHLYEADANNLQLTTLNKNTEQSVKCHSTQTYVSPLFVSWRLYSRCLQINSTEAFCFPQLQPRRGLEHDQFGNLTPHMYTKA